MNLRIFCLLLITATVVAAPQTANIDAAFQQFWAATSLEQAGQRSQAVVRAGITFEDAMRRLKAGRMYSAQKTGIVKASYRGKDGVEYHYALNVPASYDPAKKYQVRFQLHGGVGGRENNLPRGTGEIGALAGAEQIYIMPYAWRDAPWWSNSQVANLNAILDIVTRTYNVDENRVALAGVSDGGTGAYFIGMRETTRYASLQPMNAFIMVLANDEIDDATSFPGNLRNKPLFVVNGGQDRLYPTRNVEPYVNHLMNNGVETLYLPQPNAGHNTAWWPELKDTFEKFVADHPRDPHPDRLTWETTDLAHNRAHWLVIDQLGVRPGDATQMPDMNAFKNTFGTSNLFARTKRSGRVDLVRSGNTVQATTKGVAAFTLLLSPDEFDFSQPVRVVVNGRTLFDQRVERDAGTLLKWAARDNDRTMLYGAEIQIKLP